MTRMIGVILLTLLVFTGCNGNDVVDEALSTKDNDQEAVDQVVESVEKGPQYHKISVDEAKEKMVDGVVILDVRTQEEYELGHIEGAILLPYDQILEGVYTGLDDKDQVILVYCRSGRRSKIGAKGLVEAGYTKVYDFGGINDWPDQLVK